MEFKKWWVLKSKILDHRKPLFFVNTVCQKVTKLYFQRQKSIDSFFFLSSFKNINLGRLSAMPIHKLQLFPLSMLIFGKKSWFENPPCLKFHNLTDTNVGTSFHEKLGHHNLESVMLDLMIGGVETTSTALTWATLFMIKYPDIQRRVQNEIFTQVHTLWSVNNGAAGDMQDTCCGGYRP